MKIRYFKTNGEYFRFINKYKDMITKVTVIIKNNKIKVKYMFQ